MKIEVGKKYKDREGIIWKIEAKLENKDIEYPYVAINEGCANSKRFVNYAGGLEFTSNWLTSDDIEPIKVKSLVRVCIYKGSESGACWDCNSRDCIDKININCKDNVIGTKVVEIEVTEGEGM